MRGSSLPLLLEFLLVLTFLGRSALARLRRRLLLFLRRQPLGIRKRVFKQLPHVFFICDNTLVETHVLPHRHAGHRAERPCFAVRDQSLTLLFWKPRNQIALMYGKEHVAVHKGDGAPKYFSLLSTRVAGRD